jgi:hypothetical protein
MTNGKGTTFRFGACMCFVQALFCMMIPVVTLSAVQPQKTLANVWYTQIGQWRLHLKVGPAGESFLSHDSRIDGARSGQATANVRSNILFQDIHRCEARCALGPAPASTAFLVQNMRVTYYFLIQKGVASDSLKVFRFHDNCMILLRSVPANISDTTAFSVTLSADSLIFLNNPTKISIPKPLDFIQLTSIGFECFSGSVKVFDVTIEAQNILEKETFDKATLFNLHLDKMQSGADK